MAADGFNVLLQLSGQCLALLNDEAQRIAACEAAGAVAEALGSFSGQTAKPPTKEKADGFALSPQNGAVVLSQRRRWGHRTDGEKFTFASHPEERSTSQGTPSPTEKG